jgi:hypothetical protein
VPTGSATSSSSSSSPSSRSGKADHPRARGLLRRLSHAQIVTRGKGGGFVTHDLIKGTVTSVSATSITVRAADSTTETFVVNTATKVRVRSDGKGAAATIGDVAKGDAVLVAGTGTSTRTAKHVVDVKK